MSHNGATDFALKVESIGKFYRLYDTPFDRFKEALHPLRKKYHQPFYAVHDVSFQISKGETVGIIGRNGSGKSTLLKMLAGVLTPSSGSVAVNGRVLALLELGAGFNPELTGIENIYFSGVLYGATQQEMDSRLDAIITFADIGEFIYQPVKTYSSGMYVRLAFAVIANMDAEVLIIDEALSVGDAFFVQKCMRFLRHFTKNGTLIFVSHDISAITSLCSRAIWLNQGVMKLDGSPKEVAEAYLENYYEIQQETNSQKEIPGGKQFHKSDARDMRLDFLNASNLRNDIQLFEFAVDGRSFGAGGADIQHVSILDELERPLSWCVGGENVILEIQCLAKANLECPIVGFIVRDRLGQIIFSDNTYLTYASNPQIISVGQSFTACFSFRMPIMPNGDYSISIAVAEGTQEDHIQHRWIDDALMFKIESTFVCHGLIGIPMTEVSIFIDS